MVALVLGVIAHEACEVQGSPVTGAMNIGLDFAISAGARRLNLITFGINLAQDLANAIVDGDIDMAADILVRAVRGGYSDSVIQGLFMADNKLGITQTIVRALGLGLDTNELADVVESSGQQHTETAQVVEDVLVLIDGTLVPGKQTADGQIIIQDATGPYSAASDQSTQPVSNGLTGTFVEGREIRQCRGQKEEQCCLEYNTALSGCLCDDIGQCRFEYIGPNPVIVRDTRRSDSRACSCP